MPPQPIPFDEGQAGAFEELAGSAPFFVNCVRERPRGFRARPGIAPLPGFPAVPPSTTPVDAMAIIGNDLIYATRDRKVFAWRSTTGQIVDLSFSGGDSLIAGAEPIVLSASRNWVIGVGGGVPQLITNGLLSRRLGGGPPAASDVTVIAQVIVLIEAGLSGLAFWSDPGDAGAEYWDLSLAFVEAEARPDRLVACEASARELWLYGSQTTQIYVPDQEQIFAPGPAIENGITSKRAPIRFDTRTAWLDDRARILFSGGRDIAPEDVLSDQGISSTLKDLSRVDDCWGFRAAIANHDFLVWVFPTAGRTFAWDVVTSHWAEWRGWSAGRWVTFAPTSHLYWPERRLHLLGMPDGTIAQLSATAYDDLGAPLRWVSRTSFGEGTNPLGRRTHHTDMRIRTRRGFASESASINITWRDDPGAFEPALVESLGAPGDYNPIVTISPVGAPFEQRQYEMSGSADNVSAVIGATATAEVAE